MIISRYLAKEVLTALLAVTFVLLLIFLSDQLVRYLGYAASGKIAPHIVLQLMEFEIPYLLALLLPLGLYLGVMLVYGRLYADSELRVLHACGFSISRLTAITAGLASLIAVVVAILMFWINPLIAAEKEKLLAHSAGTSNILETLMPGRFRVSNEGSRVIYVEKISRDHKQARNIFIADETGDITQNNASSWVVLSADRGYQVKNPMTHDRYVVAADGFRYDGAPGENNYRITQFKEYAARIPPAELSTKHQAQESIPTKTLFKNYHNNPDNIAELQWRISFPLSAFLLALLAIPLSQVKPRQGRYAMLLPAILVYVVYVNLLFVARNLLEQKLVPMAIGMWWVHAIIFILITLFLLVQSGWKTRRV